MRSIYHIREYNVRRLSLVSIRRWRSHGNQPYLALVARCFFVSRLAVWCGAAWEP